MNELSTKALALALTGLLGACASDAAPVKSAVAGEGPRTSQYAPGEVIVQFRAGTSADRVGEIVNATGMRIDKSLGSPLVYLLRYSGEIPIDEMIQRLKSYPEVRNAEPNRVIRLDPPQPSLLER